MVEEELHFLYLIENVFLLLLVFRYFEKQLRRKESYNGEIKALHMK
ncbi:hypothetical protein RchiOBHm_Chr1g0325841 [Rosa chinensis]|uniref:Uncharacterized protein n=1 Tax=Rosa chinensis TaxID=74649 RepID=A0A2P6SA38_ROSCH|nr:hypothetical protein RchiOBHm_Chr1g0325841 [Rosa chinensis]